MKVLSRIFRQLNVLHVRFDNDGEPAVDLVSSYVRKGKVETGETRALSGIETEKEVLKTAPLIVAVSGKRVITKDASSGGIVDTVTSDPETFLWTESADGNISFVRRSQLVKIAAELTDAGITPLYTECLPDGSGEQLTAAAERFLLERLKWNTVLKPSVEGSQLASLLAKRIQLPVLGIVLLALMVNFMLSSGVREDFQAANTELTALRKSAATSTASSDRRQVAIEQFSRSLPYRFSWLSDRIAAAVPEKVVLTELNLCPVTKNIEAGKPVQQRERIVVIRGETSSAESVASFVESLGGLGAGAVRLSSVEQDKERSLLTFRIDIEL